MRLPFSSTGTNFFSSTTGACLTGVGNDATWPKRMLASCKFLARERCFYCDTPGPLGFYVAARPQLWTSWTDTSDFPSPLFILWFVSLRKQGSVSCGWSCNGTKMRGKYRQCSQRGLGWINRTTFFKHPVQLNYYFFLLNNNVWLHITPGSHLFDECLTTFFLWQILMWHIILMYITEMLKCIEFQKSNLPAKQRFNKDPLWRVFLSP